MNLTFPGESAEYRRARDQLLDDEIELRRAMDGVAVPAQRLFPPRRHGARGLRLRRR